MDEGVDDTGWEPEDALDDFLDLLALVTPSDARAMAAAWTEIDPVERTAAWALVRTEATGAGRDPTLDDARAAVLRWAEESSHILEGSPYSVTYASDLDRQASRVRAVAPVLDAAAASILRDRLPRETFEILYGPFAIAIAPADDVALDDEDDDDEDDFDDDFDDEEEEAEGADGVSRH